MCDISHPNFEEQYAVVNETIKSIVKDEKPTLVLFNKIDNYSFVEKDEADLSERSAENISLDELEKTYMARLSGNYGKIETTETVLSEKNEELDRLNDV